MHFMNKQHGAHMRGHASSQEENAHASDDHQAEGQERVPHIHIQPHHDGEGNHVRTTLHVMHHHGGHEKHEFEPGDHEGIAAKIQEHYGQDHGGSSGEEMEDEHGFGPGV